MSGRFMLFRKLAIMLIFISLLSSVIIVVYAQAGEVWLGPTDNTYVDSNYPNSNYGGQEYLQIHIMFMLIHALITLGINHH